MSEEIIIYHDTNEMKIGNKIIYDVDKDILNYIKYLEQKVEQLEKEKDYLDDYNRHLHNENKQLENIRKEAIQITESIIQGYHQSQTMIPSVKLNNLLNILNKRK